jgi:hypothetical protein
MYEARHQEPLARELFQRRLAWHMSGAGLVFLIAAALVLAP